MAAYRAEIEIGVRGVRSLEELRSSINQTATAVDSLNQVVSARGGLVQNIQNYTNNLNRAARSLELVGAGTEAETKAVREYVRALGEANTARARQNSLIAQQVANQRQIRPGDAGLGQQTPALPPSLIKAQEIQQGWNTFFSEAAELAQDLQSAAAAKALNIKTTWNTFFTEAAEVAQQLKSNAAAKALNIRTAWNTFFEDAAQLGAELAAKTKQTTAEIRSREGAASAAARERLAAGVKPAAPAAGGIRGMLQKPGVADALIGGSFPLLFGGGAGATIGGAAGGFIGGSMGGPLGMALSLALSAVGTQLDAAVAKVKDLQNAINTLDADKLRESFVFVNAELDRTISKLISAGEYDAARAEAAAAAAAQTGAIGTAIEDSANATAILGASWTDLVGTVSTTLSIIGAPFEVALAAILAGVSGIFKIINFILSAVGTGIKTAVEAIVRLFPGGQQLLDGIAQTIRNISEGFGAAKTQAQEANDTLARQFELTNKLYQIDKLRTNDVSLRGKLRNIEADMSEKIVQIEEAAAQKKKDFAKENKGATEESVRLAFAQIDAEATRQKQMAATAAQRQRELALAQQQLAVDQQRITFVQMENSVLTTKSQLYQQLSTIRLTELEASKETAASLAAELNIISTIAAEKTAAAQQAYADAVREADVKAQTAQLEYQSVQNQYARGQADEIALQTASKAYSTAQQIRDVTLQSAEATRQHAIAMADLESRQQKVAAYTKETNAAAQAAVGTAQTASQLYQNQQTLIQGLAQAYTAINNAQIQSLQLQLQNTDSVSEKQGILLRIRDLEISNATYALQATRAQIRAEVERAAVATRTAQITYKTLEAQVRYAEAQGLANREHYRALEAQRQALNLAYDNLRVTQSVADAQSDAANAVYNAAVQAANLKYATEGAAAAAGKYASSMESAAGSARAAASANAMTTATQGSGYGYRGKMFGGAYAVDNVILQEQGRAIWDAASKRIQGSSPRRAAEIRAEAEAAITALQRPYLEQQRMQVYSGAAQQLQSLGMSSYTTSTMGQKSAAAASAQAGMQKLQEQMQAQQQQTQQMLQAMTSPTTPFNPVTYTSQNTTSTSTTGTSNYSAQQLSAPTMFSPQINVTTGPVYRMDNQDYVTTTDLQKAMQTTANSIYTGLQSTSMRQSIGMF